MLVMLDATAGNRMMWKHSNYKPRNTIFLDKEIDLRLPPDVIADNRFCPFRDGVFECIIYDPPHYVNAPIWFRIPNSGTGTKHNRETFYGNFESKKEMITSIYNAQNEFQRLTKRLCLKWFERSISLWKILPFFRDWSIINKREVNPTHKSRSAKTYWITFSTS